MQEKLEKTLVDFPIDCFTKQFFFSILTLLTWNETLYFLIDFWALYARPYCKVGSFFHLLPFAGNRRTTILPTTSVTWSLYYNAHWLRWSQNCSTDLLKFEYRRLDTDRMANDWLKVKQCLVRDFLIIVLHLVWLILASIPIHDLLYRGAFFQFLFWWIYYCHSSKSTGKETGKTHLCAVPEFRKGTCPNMSEHV